MKPVTRLKRSPAMIDAGLPPARHASIGALTALALAVALVYPASAAMAATYTVDTAGDPGPTGTLSLRRAVQLANNYVGDTVQFDPSLVGSTITLDSGAIAISSAMTITGPGADRLTISGKNADRVFNITGDATISGLTLTQGKTSIYGGAIYANHATLTLCDSVISASTAYRGGGVFVNYGSATINGSRIVGNAATKSGGGIEAYKAATLAVMHSTISGNNGGCYGGGINASETLNVRLSYSLVSNNSMGQPAPNCSLEGGGIRVKNLFTKPTATISNSTIFGNYGYGGGGGVSFVKSSFVNGSFEITHSTITNNLTSVGSGNGVYVNYAGSVLIANSIVANNSSRYGDADLTGTFNAYADLIKARGSAVITGASNVFDQDPQLGPLRDNGGPTLTMLPSFDSPVIDTGVAFDSSMATTDQRGQPRGAPAGHPDMGAVERQYPEDFIFRDGFGSP